MVRRLAGLTIAAALAFALTGCGASPAGHHDRLVKAAGIETLKLRCHKDVWDDVKNYQYSEIDAKTEKGPDDTVTVDLSGPDLVRLLKGLDDHFNTGISGEEDPVAERLYKALAPVIDSAKPQHHDGDPVPEVILDDAATGTSAPSASLSPSATPSP